MSDTVTFLKTAPVVFVFPGQPPLAADSEDLYDEAHWTDQTQGTQSVKPSSGGQISGGPPEVVPQATLRLQNVPPGKILSLDQAIHFSIDCACEHFTNTTLYWIVVPFFLAHSEKISTSQTLQSSLSSSVAKDCANYSHVVSLPLFLSTYNSR